MRVVVRRCALAGGRMLNRSLFSSKTEMWGTPQRLFDELNAEFSFTVDVCAIPDNAKCARYFDPTTDGLRQRWEGVCWMNPPYGTEIKHLGEEGAR